MSIHLGQAPDYLDTQRVCQRAADVGSLMKVLHDACASHSRLDRGTVQEIFRQLRQIQEQLPEGYRDICFDRVYELCAEHALPAFSQGVDVGMLLMTEGNRVR